MTLMMTPPATAAGPGATKVPLAGKVTVAGAADLKELLLATIGASDAIVLDVSDISDCDPTFFQLICAAHRSAVAAEKQLSISPESCDRLRQLAVSAGFHPAGGCGCEAGSCLLPKEDL